MNFALCFHLQLQNSVFCACSGCLEGGGLKLAQALNSLWVERPIQHDIWGRRGQTHSGPPPPDFICICMAQSTIAGFQACQLQRSKQSPYCLARRCLPWPRRAICCFLQVGVGQGRAGLGGVEGVSQYTAAGGLSEVWLVWAGFGEKRGWGSWLSYGILPAAVGTIIYWQALGETLVNTAQRPEISCVWVQQQNHLLCL